MKGTLGPASLLATLLLAGCQPSAPPRPPPRPTKIVTPPAPPPPKAGPEMFAATSIDEVDDPEAPQFFARGKDSAMLVFVRGPRFFARPAALDGTPRGAQAVDIGIAPGAGDASAPAPGKDSPQAGKAAPAPASAPLGATDLVVGALRAVGDGYVFAWAEHDGGRTKIAEIGLDGAGAVKSSRTTLAETSDEVSSISVIPREGGSIVMWGVEHGPRVDVTGVVLDKQGASPGPVVPIVSGVLAFDPAPNGGALAVVMPGEAKDGVEETGVIQKGKVELVMLDASGKPRSTVDVSASATAQPDVLLAELGGRLVLAWTDEREVDAAVYTAVVDRNGTIVTAPKRATPPTGEQALVALAAGEAGGPTLERGLIAWEDVLRAPAETRQIHLATIGADGVIGKERAGIDVYGDGSRPSVSADAKGFGALTLARAWQGGAPPPDAPVWPTFVRFGPDLSLLSAEPVRAGAFGSDGVPYLVHDLSCATGACSIVGVGSQGPAKVAVVSLESRKTDWYAPARRDSDDVPPRAASLAALYNGESISRIAVAPTAGGELAAWVTYFAEGDAAAKNKRDGGAEVALLPVVPGAKTQAAPITLTKKAVSIGGVAISPAVGGKKEIAVAWVQREKGEAQVYVAKIDEAGKKLTQKKITVVPRAAKKGAAASEASDVGLAWSSVDNGEGWIVSWVDTRDGNAEVYAAKLDRSLNKSVPDRRITDAPGDAAEVHLLMRGKETLVTWSDARSKPDEGKGDIFVARLDTRSLNKLAPETRLASTPAHSRSPQLLSAPGGAVWATWIEDAGEGTDGAGALRVAVLDDKGSAVTTTTLPGGAHRALVSASIACGDKACRGVVAEASPEALLLSALQISPNAQAASGRTLLTLPGAGGADISPVFADRDASALFFGADATSGTGRLRRLKIEW